MTWTHERVEELLAARALDGLDAEEAALAERALIEHVPGCPRCREALDAYGQLAGDIALLADPVAPPGTLDARVRRTVSRRRRTTARAGWSVVAAAVVALGLVGWNLALTMRLGDTQETQGWLSAAISSMGHPDGSVVPLTGEGPGRVSMVYIEGEESLYLLASRLPDPDGSYRVWLMGHQRTWSPGSLEIHGEVAFLFVRTDPDRWDFVMVTEETEEDAPGPTSSPLVSAPVE
jgi:hypothetical protein